MPHTGISSPTTVTGIVKCKNYSKNLKVETPNRKQVTTHSDVATLAFSLGTRDGDVALWAATQSAAARLAQVVMAAAEPEDRGLLAHLAQ